VNIIPLVPSRYILVQQNFIFSNKHCASKQNYSNFHRPNKNTSCRIVYIQQAWFTICINSEGYEIRGPVSWLIRLRISSFGLPGKKGRLLMRKQKVDKSFKRIKTLGTLCCCCRWYISCAHMRERESSGEKMETCLDSKMTLTERKTTRPGGSIFNIVLYLFLRSATNNKTPPGEVIHIWQHDFFHCCNIQSWRVLWICALEKYASIKFKIYISLFRSIVILIRDKM
jgi:hypothetical protein